MLGESFLQGVHAGVNQHGNWCHLSLTFGMKLSITL